MIERLLEGVEDGIERARMRSCCSRHFDGLEKPRKPQTCMISSWVRFEDEVEAIGGRGEDDTKRGRPSPGMKGF